MAAKKDVYTRVIEKFGKKKQLIQALEELSELQKVICKIIRYEGDHFKTATYKDELQDELADVEIMIAQIRKMYPMKKEELTKIKNLKLAKLENYL